MENSGIIKQAKSDIFKVMHPIITFYINKGAKPASLRKYYKNNKRFSDLLSDINNKGINLVKDEKEYEKLVREILSDILNDFIAKDKDKEYKTKQDSKMKHIKEFNSYNESFMGITQFLVGAYLIYKFLMSLLKNQVDKLKNERDRKSIENLLIGLKAMVANNKKVTVVEFADRFFMKLPGLDVRLLKNEKQILIFSSDYNNEVRISLNDDEYIDIMKIINK